MAELFPPQPASDTAENTDAEAEALLFARCSQPPGTEDKLGDDMPRQRGNAASQLNLRRTHLTYRHLVISLSTSLVIGLLLLTVGWWFYSQRIEPRLSGAATAPVEAAPAPAPAVTDAPAPAAPDSALKAELAQSAELIATLQKQVDVMRREQLLMQQNTRESLEKISATLKNPELVPSTAATPTGQPGSSRMADVAPNISPTQQEFIILKERNRLTQYADEAIATGLRRPLEVLVEYMRDPQLEHLHDAAQAEFMRAVRAIQLLQREDPGYRLPVTDLFKGSPLRDEADLKPEDLLKLLADYKLPWEVRVRVCFLLLNSPLPETNARLIKSIKEDPSLDVAKHAQLALEQRVKKRFRFLDIPAIEEWFQSQEK